MAEESKKFYWLKLDRGFFKRHDIRIVEGMTNGKDYILFYLKLLCESIDHEGRLRFSERIPYSEEMLATITCTSVDTVRSAVKLFTELEMMELMDDGTYFMCQVNKMIGCETEWAEKKREYREKKRLEDEKGTNEDNVLLLSETKKTESDKSKRKSKSKSTEKDTEYTDRNSIVTPIQKKENDVCINNIDAGAREGEIAFNEGWRTSPKARGAVAQRIIDEMRREGLEHADRNDEFDALAEAMAYGIGPEELMQKAREMPDHIDYCLWRIGAVKAAQAERVRENLRKYVKEEVRDTG